MSFQNAVHARLGNNTKHLSELTQSQVRPLLQRMLFIMLLNNKIQTTESVIN